METLISIASSIGVRDGTAIFTALVGVLVFAFGVRQYQKAQAWKKSEFVAAEVKAFLSDPMIRTALTMLDWHDRIIDLSFDRTTTVAVRITYSTLAKIIVPHIERPSRSFSQTEATIRDCFDKMLERLALFEHFIESNLVTVDDLKIYLDYWVRLICDETMENRPDDLKEVREALWSFIIFYKYESVQRLFARWGYKRPASTVSGRQTHLQIVLKRLKLTSATLFDQAERAIAQSRPAAPQDADRQAK